MRPPPRVTAPPVYPDGSPSFRLLELRNGIVAAEKLRILGASDESRALLKHFDYNVAQTEGYDWRVVRKTVERVVNHE